MKADIRSRQFAVIRSKAMVIAVILLAVLSSAVLSAQTQNDEQLLRRRETVWRAWFAGDTKTLEELAA
jgi:hypothetical protein